MRLWRARLGRVLLWLTAGAVITSVAYYLHLPFPVYTNWPVPLTLLIGADFADPRISSWVAEWVVRRWYRPRSQTPAPQAAASDLSWVEREHISRLELTYEHTTLVVVERDGNDVRLDTLDGGVHCTYFGATGEPHGEPVSLGSHVLSVKAGLPADEDQATRLVMLLSEWRDDDKPLTITDRFRREGSNFVYETREITDGTHTLSFSVAGAFQVPIGPD